MKIIDHYRTRIIEAGLKAVLVIAAISVVFLVTLLLLYINAGLHGGAAFVLSFAVTMICVMSALFILGIK